MDPIPAFRILNGSDSGFPNPQWIRFLRHFRILNGSDFSDNSESSMDPIPAFRILNIMDPIWVSI